MDNPKQRYPLSVANRLRRFHPCPDCGQMGQKRIGRDTGSEINPLDPEVNVIWYCPTTTCSNHNGFYIETR